MNPFLVLVPSLLLEVNHASNIEQHFADRPTNYGYSTASAYLHWELGQYAYVDIGDGRCKRLATFFAIPPKAAKPFKR